jgi:hypothetical protein
VDGLCPYTPFYPDESIPYWPDIIQRGFLRGFRDWPLPPEILPAGLELPKTPGV